MALYLCNGGSGDVKIHEAFKQFFCPSWLPKQPIESFTPINLLAHWYFQGEQRNAGLIGALSIDQHTYIMPAGFDPVDCIVAHKSEHVYLYFFNTTPSLENGGYLKIPTPYIVDINVNDDTKLNSVISSNNTYNASLGSTIQNSTYNITGRTGDLSVIFSTFDLSSPNDKYHIYKNIKITDFNIQTS